MFVIEIRTIQVVKLINGVVEEIIIQIVKLIINRVVEEIIIQVAKLIINICINNYSGRNNYSSCKINNEYLYK